MLKSLYIRKDDEAFWARAEELAKTEKIALSVWLTRLVQKEVYRSGSKSTQSVDDLLADLQARVVELRQKVSSS